MAIQCVFDWAIKNFCFPIYDEYHINMFEAVSIQPKDSIEVARTKLMYEILNPNSNSNWADLIADEIYHAFNENKDEHKKVFDAVNSLTSDELKRLYQQFETNRINNGKWDDKIEYYRSNNNDDGDDE